MNEKDRNLVLRGAFVLGASILGACDKVSPEEVEAAPRNYSIGRDFAIPLPPVEAVQNDNLPRISQTPITIEEDLEVRLLDPRLEERIIAESFIMPIEGGVARGWDYLEDVSAEGVGKRFHAGIDINWLTGNEDFGIPALSISDGICVYAKDSEGEYGNVVIMEYLVVNERGKDEKIYSLYAHLNEIMAKEGEVYRLGEEIGTVGRSGGVEYSHLHWEIFNEEHFNFILENGIKGFWFDLEYIERTHENPLYFLELHK